jgi:polyhydroxybutyrate depolymerase
MLLILAFVLLLAALALTLIFGRSTQRRWVALKGGRRYLISLPARPEGARIIVALHGGGGGAARFAQYSRLAEDANPRGYAVIFAEGTGRFGHHSFNAGYCCGFAAEMGVDDLGYLDAVIEDAKVRFRLDPGPVVLAGVSNGAMMAEAYAATRPEAVRAVVGVAGTLDLARFPPQGPVPALIIHGTADRNVPFEGGLGPRARNRVPGGFTPVRNVIAAFLKPWGAGVRAEERAFPVDAEGFALRETTWSLSGHPVLRLIAVEGGDHTWPGINVRQHKGRAPATMSTNREILRFLDDLEGSVAKAA